MISLKDRIAQLAGFSFHNGKIISIFIIVFAVFSPFLIKGLQLETLSASQSTADDPVSRIYVDNLRRFGDSDALMIYLEFSQMSSEQKNTFTNALAAELSSWDDVVFVDTKPFDFDDKDRAAHLIRTVLLNSDHDIRNQFMEKFSESGLLRELRKTRKKLITLPDPALRELAISDVLNLREIILPFFEIRMGNFKFSSLDGYFDSEDGAARLVFVQPARPSEDADFCADFISRIDRAITSSIESMGKQESESIQYALSGKYSLVGESMQILRQDMRHITLAALVLIFILLCVAFRNVRAVFVCFFPLCISVLAVLVLARFFFNPLNYLALGFVAIVLGLGVDVMLHCTGRFFQMLKDPATAGDTVKLVVQEAGPPISIGLTTTAVAFLCLIFATHPPLFQFGLLTSLGLMVTLVLGLFLFPVSVRIFGPKPNRRIKPIRFHRFPPWVGKIPLKHPFLALGGVLVILLVCLFFLRSFSFNMDFFVAFPRKLDAFDTSREISERFGVSFFLNSQLTLEAKDLKSAMAAQRILDEKMIQLSKENRIASFQSASLFRAYTEEGAGASDLQRAAALITQNQDSFFNLLDELKFEKRASYDNYYAMLEAAVVSPKEKSNLDGDGIKSFPQMNKFVASENDKTYLQTYVWPLSTSEGFLPIDKKTLQEIASLELPAGIRLHVSGTQQVFEQVGKVVRSDFFRVSLITLLAVLLVIFLFFRRIKNVFLSLLPLAVAVPFTLAMVVISKISFSPFQIGVAAILIGIGIDDAVHLLVRTIFLEKRKIEEVLLEIGPVITLTTLSTMIGFGAMIFSRNRAVSSMGFVISLGVLSSLIFTIVLIPSALKVLQKKK